jgi:uncharacterized protein with PIN domain
VKNRTRLRAVSKQSGPIYRIWRLVKFITDLNLGKLSKWLRILGYDTVYYTGNVDRSFLRMAQKEGRVALTRKRDLAQRQFSGELVVIHNDRVENQLNEIIDKRSLVPEPDQLFTICLKCNEKLRAVSREEVSGMVPDYIFRRHTRFHLCPRCSGIFWPGTHKEKVVLLMTRIQRRSP